MAPALLATLVLAGISIAQQTHGSWSGQRASRSAGLIFLCTRIPRLGERPACYKLLAGALKASLKNAGIHPARGRAILPQQGLRMLPRGPGGAAEQAADLVLFNGNIYTVNDAQPRAEAVAARAGRIVF